MSVHAKFVCALADALSWIMLSICLASAWMHDLAECGSRALASTRPLLARPDAREPGFTTACLDAFIEWSMPVHHKKARRAGDA